MNFKPFVKFMSKLLTLQLKEKLTEKWNFTENVLIIILTAPIDCR